MVRSFWREYVNYPPQSPMSAYFLNSWTIIHQFGALLLRAGIYQTYVNKFLFVIPCVLLVCAYAMIIYGFSGRFLLSLLGASLCYLANPLARLFASPDYPTLGLLWKWVHRTYIWNVGANRSGLGDRLCRCGPQRARRLFGFGAYRRSSGSWHST